MTPDTNNIPPSLNDAPAHVKLAVDLIMLFEQNEIDPNVAIEALEIVKQDCQRKITCKS